ncbi:MAG: ATP-binding cassette domain-containing protein [Propionibacteriaceae bacterium]|jgi:ABC-2 type transport system ATP-binding protein|nr:ATP-binding cassette domain-containing protein [Propionibacteriaceae bacterium]
MSVDVIRVEGVTKTFTIRKQKSLKDRLVNSGQGKLHTETFSALDHVDFTVQAGESIGLVGPNGSGKSTLLKIIGGILAPDSGQVLVRGRIAALLELGAGFHPDLTGRENVFLNASVLGLTDQETRTYFDDIVDFSGISDFIDTQVKFYSSGMYIRLAFSVAVHVDPDILLVDEVLAVGDEPFQIKCMNKIHQFQDEGRTIVLVSHSAGQVADVCDRAIVLEKGHLVEDSVPSIALQRLRRDYQEIMDSSTPSESSADPTVTIERVFLTDSLGSPAISDWQVVMPPGSELQVHCLLDFIHTVPGWHIQVRIESFTGALMLSTDTDHNLAQTLPGLQGQHEILIKFPDLRLGEDDYNVTITVFDQNNRALTRLAQAANFAVRTDKRTTGPVYSSPIVEIIG